ncbi:diacylglycerol kinase family protein [Acidocella sp. MX-AZ02]|uniref:diacylglycerol/lipid kinase family protein n=1 Tax=Acidocella sp. MX-AZ02 TaxID=1214225 RepID=UPI00034DFC51|nr:diacylglycerol kinase family protein [Acidocella sp. MX-AZ02]
MLVIFNPVAGRRRATALWRVLDLLVENGVKIEVAETQHAGHATDLARQAAREGAFMVVAAGGDGTIAEVANGLIGTDTALGIIPLGTANVLAKEYGLSTHPRGIANTLAYKRCKPLWPGVAQLPGQGHVFVQMLGLGFDGAVVKGVRPLLKRAIGKGAYVWQSVWESVAYDFPPVQLSVDGVTHQAASVVVSKGRLYGGPYLLAPLAQPGQPGFQVVLFEKPGTLPALLSGAALPLGLLPRCPGVRVLAGSHVEFSAPNGRISTHADGDTLPALPRGVVSAQAPISLIVG